MYGDAARLGIDEDGLVLCESSERFLDGDARNGFEGVALDAVWAWIGGGEDKEAEGGGQDDERGAAVVGRVDRLDCGNGPVDGDGEQGLECGAVWAEGAAVEAVEFVQDERVGGGAEQATRHRPELRSRRMGLRGVQHGRRECAGPCTEPRKPAGDESERVEAATS